MDARRCNPFLGLAIVVSISVAAQAQYIPAGSIVAPQPMMVHPSAMPVAVPGAMSGAMPMMAGTPMVMPGVMPGAGPVMASAPMMHGATGSATRPPKQRTQAVAETENFIVFASDKAWAEEVAKTAEDQRRKLAQHWLGRELPPWSGRCPVHVHDAPELGAGGETRFVVEQGVAHNWMMSVQGTRERILDSVLPHEISHTIFATHFGRLNKYVPRWADEGSATTVEHEAEKSKHRHYLRKFLQTGRGLAFNKMFQLKEYPKDILPLYAQGHSAVQFLIDQSNPRHFIQFLELGMQTENWPAALKTFYDYESIGEFQSRWNKWLFDGSPTDLQAYAPFMAKQLAKQQPANVTLASSAGQAAPSPRQAASTQISQTGRLPSDPQALDLLPSHSQGNPQVDAIGNRSPSTQVADNQLPASDVVSQSGDLLSLEDAIALADQQPSPEPTSRVAAADSSGESWFKRQLRQTSGQPATPIPQHNNFPGDRATNENQQTLAASGNFPSNAMAGLRPAARSSNASTVYPPSSGTSTGLPQQPQGVTVQVLEWGQGLRTSGSRTDAATYR